MIVLAVFDKGADKNLSYLKMDRDKKIRELNAVFVIFIYYYKKFFFYQLIQYFILS